MSGVKVSVSLPDEDVAFLDDYAREAGVTRSAAMHQAIDVLRRRGLTVEYAAAFEEWHSAGEAEVWDAVVGDGLCE
jgi:antitoxin MazE9